VQVIVFRISCHFHSSRRGGRAVPLLYWKTRPLRERNPASGCLPDAGVALPAEGVI